MTECPLFARNGRPRRGRFQAKTLPAVSRGGAGTVFRTFGITPNPASAQAVSEQAERLEGVVAGFAYHDVVVDRDAEFGGGLLDLAGHLDIGLGRRGVAGGVVVHQVALDEQTYVGLR